LGIYTDFFVIDLLNIVIHRASSRSRALTHRTIPFFIGAEYDTMEMAGLCAYCGRPGVMYSCQHCGQQVCKAHYNAKYNICSACGGS